MVFEEKEKNQKTVLPFFADGYPGILFHQTTNGLWVSPYNQYQPQLFLYGQTIKPIELVTTGPYCMLVFQLYPFVLKSFFNVIPKDLNDACYDLSQMQKDIGVITLDQLNQKSDSKTKVAIITSLLQQLFNAKRETIDHQIGQAIRTIIHGKGIIRIGKLAKELHLTERTFERRFLSEVGISAKQFAKIIQFQQSLEQFSIKDYLKLSDIVYVNGFSDQSHFIRVFKSFTGKSPSAFKKQ